MTSQLRASSPARLSSTVRQSAGDGIPRTVTASAGIAAAYGSVPFPQPPAPNPSLEVAINAPRRDVGDALVAAVQALDVGRAVGGADLLDDIVGGPADVHLVEDGRHHPGEYVRDEGDLHRDDLCGLRGLELGG